jgi:outer membrane lipoprotein-sorting protein
MLGLTGVRTVRQVVRTDGIVDRWASGRDGTIVQTADRDSENLCLESSAESSDITLNSGIPDKSIFTKK